MIQTNPNRIQLFERYFKADESFMPSLFHFNQPFIARKIVTLGKINQKCYDLSRFSSVRMNAELPILISLDDSNTVYEFEIYLDGYYTKHDGCSPSKSYINWKFDNYDSVLEEYEKLMRLT